MATVSEISPQFRLGAAQKTELSQPSVRITAKQWLPFSGTNLAAPQFKLDAAKPKASEVEKAFDELEKSYEKLLTSINLKAFNRSKIEDYLRLAEKRAGMEISEKEKLRLRKMAQSEDPKVLRLLALELRIGIPRKAEKEAMAALGQMMLYRQDRKSFEKFLAAPDKDENLKAYVRTIIMMNRVEDLMYRYENFKGQVRNLFNMQRLIPGMSS